MYAFLPVSSFLAIRLVGATGVSNTRGIERCSATSACIASAMTNGGSRISSLMSAVGCMAGRLRS